MASFLRFISKLKPNPAANIARRIFLFGVRENSFHRSASPGVGLPAERAMTNILGTFYIVRPDVTGYQFRAILAHGALAFAGTIFANG